MEQQTIVTERGTFEYKLQIPRKPGELLTLSYWGLGKIEPTLTPGTEFAAAWLRLDGYEELFAAPLHYQPEPDSTGNKFRVIVCRSVVDPIYQNRPFQNSEKYEQYVPFLAAGMVITNPYRLYQQSIFIRRMQQKRKHPSYWFGILNGIWNMISNIYPFTTKNGDPLIVCEPLLEKAVQKTRCTLYGDISRLGFDRGKKIVLSILSTRHGETVSPALMASVGDAASQQMRQIPGWFAYCNNAVNL